MDFLAGASIRHWQLCPVGPTGYGDSPYQSFSSFAGNPYFLDLGELVEAGLLEAREVSGLEALPTTTVDYGRLYQEFWPILGLAHDRFTKAAMGGLPGVRALDSFRSEHRGWLEPFAAYMALKGHFQGAPWMEWPESFRQWSPGLLAFAPETVRRDADRHIFYQYLFFHQWERLRAYAASRNVSIIGDVPIFVALDSADTWQHREIFQLDEQGRPRSVAGVPPDYFSAKGQLWGNPLYDWEELERTGYAWWIERLRAAFAWFDIIRLDHFRGFDTYWEIPYGAPDATLGCWRKGPGLPFFQAVGKALPHVRIIAEDLGYIGPDVVSLRRNAGLPGMKIVQFAYGHDANNANLPHFHTPESVVYTGTHDNVPVRAWLSNLPAPYREKIDSYFQLAGSTSAWPIIRAAFASVSRLAVVPTQDILDLDAAATLNRPGTAEGNWQWRFTGDQLDRLKKLEGPVLAKLVEQFDRLGVNEVRDYSEPPQN